VRLNLAIINAAIAQHDTNARLVASTADFLADPSGMVVLWGMKAAKYELAGKPETAKGLSEGRSHSRRFSTLSERIPTVARLPMRPMKP